MDDFDFLSLLDYLCEDDEEVLVPLAFFPASVDELDSMIKKVIFNSPATVVLWNDGSKTVVKCDKDDEYSRETGFLACIVKYLLGNTGKWNELLKKWTSDKDDVYWMKTTGELNEDN